MGFTRDGSLLADISERIYDYPLSYGGTCGPHDQALPPYCNVTAPETWCSDPWCYVDPAHCDTVYSSSSYFAYAGDTYYSYQTCGAVSTYVVELCLDEDKQTFRDASSNLPDFYLTGEQRTSGLEPPIVSITSCLDAPYGNEPCGPLEHGRLNFSNDCARAAALVLAPLKPAHPSTASPSLSPLASSRVLGDGAAGHLMVSVPRVPGRVRAQATARERRD